MRRFIHKPYHKTTHWFCRRCESVFTTDLAFFRRRCGCGAWMEHMTEAEWEKIKRHLAFE